MDKEISGINKKFDKKFFGEIPMNDVVDLTYIEQDVRTLKYFDPNEFNQILKINLPQKSKQNVLNLIRKLEKIDGILWAGPNTYDSPAALPANSTGSRYSGLWGMHGSYGIQAEAAWNISTGNRKVRVGVIDSGIATHNDLNANVTTGWDFINGNNITNDDIIGHGTHVSGTIAATGKNPNGIAGVAWNIELVPLQVTNSDGGWPLDAVTSAITWAINNNVDIINYSGGGTSDNPARRTAINNFQGVFVCAAGNDGNDNDSKKYYPADYSQGQTFSDRVITVGAINSAGNKASFSNYGAQSVSIFAPGDSILSSVPLTIDSTGYQRWNGTSMATPHVPGTAALLLSVYNKDVDSISKDLSACIKSAIVNNATESSTLNGKCKSNGRLNAYRAVSSAALQMQGNTIVGMQSNIASDIRYIPIPTYFNGTEILAIDDYAFENHTKLIQIDMPRLIEIGNYAFTGCTNLKTVTEVLHSSHSTGGLGTSFKDWVTLESLPAMNYTQLYDMGRRRLTVSFSSYFSVWGHVEYQFRLTDTKSSPTVFATSDYFTPGDGVDHSRDITFSSVNLANIPYNARLQIQIRYRKTKLLWGGHFTVTGNNLKMQFA